MKHVAPPSPAHKPDMGDSPGARDLLLTSLRVAATRSRLETNIFDSVGVALRQKVIDCAGAMEWLRDEGLLELLPFGPSAVGGST
jgi:hypothetical protein